MNKKKTRARWAQAYKPGLVCYVPVLDELFIFYAGTNGMPISIIEVEGARELAPGIDLNKINLERVVKLGKL